jgi:L-fucose dehydrogenase
MRVVIVTGGANGIGKACVIKFLQNNYIIICIDKNSIDLQQMRHEYSNKPLFCYLCDVGDHKQLQSLIQKIITTHKRIDCVINNVGVHPSATSIMDLDIDDFKKLVDINLTSSIAMCKYTFPELIKTQGTVVFVSSMVAIHGQYLADAYCATKSGMIGLTKSLSIEAAKHNIRVNCVCPSNVLTLTMTNWLNTFNNPSEKKHEMSIVQKLNRMAEPSEIANVIYFLASSESSFMTGNIIEANGGSNLDYPIVSKL